MKFAGIRSCKANEVVKYFYEHKMSKREVENLKSFVSGTFDVDAEVDSFYLSAYGDSRINGVKICNDDRILKIFDIYFKTCFDAEGLSICDAIFNGDILTLNTLNRI